MGLLALLVGLSNATSGSAAEVVLSSPATGAWRTLDFPTIPRHTSYSVINDGSGDAFKADADCSASARYLPLDHIDLTQTPRLRWRWKVERPLRPNNERGKPGDDFAARVDVLFQFDPQHASVWETVRHRLAASRYGDLVPGNVISYVWSSREPAGARWENPYAAGSQLISLGNGALPEWTEETVDVAADFGAAFGHTAPPVAAVAVMTDTDDTCQFTTTYYADLRFLGAADSP